MPSILHIRSGSIVQLADGVRGMVKTISSPTTVLVRNLVTGEDQSADIVQLKLVKSDRAVPVRNIDDLDEATFELAYRKYQAIAPLLENGSRSIDTIDAVAATLQVNRSTVYRWIAEFERDELVTNLLRKRRSDIGELKIDPRAEKIMGEVIANFWLTTQRRSMKNTHREVNRLCRLAQIPAPSYNTFRARLDLLDQAMAAKKRGGAKAAQPFRVVDGTVPYADYPYAVIQIDHTFLDVMLVDEDHRMAIGRPWITVAIDVFSRMVAGYYLSFDPPGTLGTGICIANALLSKETFLAKMGLRCSYPCMGKPKIIHVDNAKEFRGKTLEMACQQLGINLIFRKVKTPNYGGHIERYLGTLATEIHALPGATFADHAQRAVYDADKESAMTLSEMEHWLANLIVGAYHYRKHSSLNMPPLQRYTEGLLGSDTALGSGQISVFTDEESLRISFLPIVERTVQPYGVSVDGIHYFSDVLRRWAGSKDPNNKKLKRKFLFRRDPRDISFLLFYDPVASQYFRVPYRDVSRPPMSLWELHATVRYLAEQGKQNVDEGQIFKAYDEMRRIEEQSKTVTRKTRLAQTRRRHHEASRNENAASEAGPAVEQPIQDTGTLNSIVPFEEIERY